MGRPEDEPPRGSENPDPDDETARRPFNPDGGEDESSSADEDGNDDHLHEDQKPIARSSMSGTGATKAPAEMSAEELGRLARAERDAGVLDLPTAAAAVEAAQREKEEDPDNHAHEPSCVVNVCFPPKAEYAPLATRMNERQLPGGA